MKHNPAIIQLVCHSWWRPPIRRLSPTHTQILVGFPHLLLWTLSQMEKTGLALGSGLHCQPLSAPSPQQAPWPQVLETQWAFVVLAA